MGKDPQDHQPSGKGKSKPQCKKKKKNHNHNETLLPTWLVLWLDSKAQTAQGVQGSEQMGNLLPRWWEGKRLQPFWKMVWQFFKRLSSCHMP